MALQLAIHSKFRYSKLFISLLQIDIMSEVKRKRSAREKKGPGSVKTIVSGYHHNTL